MSDSILHDVLRSAAQRTGFDEVLLDLGLAAYSGPRHLELGGGSDSPMHARRGMVASCSLCTTLAKVILVEPLDRLVAKPQQWNGLCLLTTLVRQSEAP